MDRIAELALELVRDHERPRRMNAAAERRQHADAHVAELVAEALDRDRAIGRYGAGVRALLAEVGDQVAGGVGVEVVVGLQPSGGVGGVVRELAIELAAERAERLAELDGATGAIGARSWIFSPCASTSRRYSSGLFSASSAKS